MNKRGLREQIVGANSEEEVAALLKQGQSFDMASEKTRRSWKRTANKKYGSFAAPAPVVQKEASVKKTKAKKNLKTEKAEAKA